jgi:predicted ester cyclase
VALGATHFGTLSAATHPEDGPMGMSAEDTRKTITSYIDAHLSDGPYGDYLADNVTLTIVDTGDQAHGREAVIQTIDGIHKRAFAASPSIKRIVADKGIASLEANFVGPHIGEFASIAATGYHVRVPYDVTYDLEADKITSLRVYELFDGLIRQLNGASEPPFRNDPARQHD